MSTVTQMARLVELPSYRPRVGDVYVRCIPPERHVGHAVSPTVYIVTSLSFHETGDVGAEATIVMTCYVCRPDASVMDDMRVHWTPGTSHWTDDTFLLTRGPYPHAHL